MSADVGWDWQESFLNVEISNSSSQNDHLSRPADILMSPSQSRMASRRRKRSSLLPFALNSAVSLTGNETDDMTSFNALEEPITPDKYDREGQKRLKRFRGSGDSKYLAGSGSDTEGEGGSFRGSLSLNFNDDGSNSNSISIFDLKLDSNDAVSNVDSNAPIETRRDASIGNKDIAKVGEGEGVGTEKDFEAVQEKERVSSVGFPVDMDGASMPVFDQPADFQDINDLSRTDFEFDDAIEQPKEVEQSVEEVLLHVETASDEESLQQSSKRRKLARKKAKTKKLRKKRLVLQETTMLSNETLAEWRKNLVPKQRTRLPIFQRLETYYKAMEYGFTFDMVEKPIEAQLKTSSILQDCYPELQKFVDSCHSLTSEKPPIGLSGNKAFETLFDPPTADPSASDAEEENVSPKEVVRRDTEMGDEAIANLDMEALSQSSKLSPSKVAESLRKSIGNSTDFDGNMSLNISYDFNADMQDMNDLSKLEDLPEVSGEANMPEELAEHLDRQSEAETELGVEVPETEQAKNLRAILGEGGSFFEVTDGRKKRQAAQLFHKLLVLKTKNQLQLSQDNAYEDILYHTIED